MHVHSDILPAFQCNEQKSGRRDSLYRISSFKNERALKQTYRNTVELQDWALFLQHFPRLSAISFCNSILSWSSSSTIGTWTLASSSLALLVFSTPLRFCSPPSSPRFVSCLRGALLARLKLGEMEMRDQYMET